MSLTWNEIQRVVFPQDADPDVISLYVDADVWAKVGEREVRVSDRAHLDDIARARPLPHRRGRARLVRELLQRVPGLVLAAVDERRARAPHRSRRAARAPCSSTARPLRACRSAWHPNRSPTRWCTTSNCPVTSFGDGGWYWFDVVAGRQRSRRRRRQLADGCSASCVPAEPRSASPRSTSPTTACARSTRSPPTRPFATSSTGSTSSTRATRRFATRPVSTRSPPSSATP